MQTTRQITRNRFIANTSRGSFPLRLLNWIAKADARNRQSHKLRAMPDERLEDMGIPFRHADRK